MGFTKKQRREQKKLHSELRIKARRELKLKTGNKQNTMSVVIRTIWTTPEGEQPSMDKRSRVPLSADLERLQRKHQTAMEKRTAEEHPDWSVVVTVLMPDPLPESAASEDNSPPLSEIP